MKNDKNPKYNSLHSTNALNPLMPQYPNSVLYNAENPKNIDSTNILTNPLTLNFFIIFLAPLFGYMVLLMSCQVT